METQGIIGEDREALLKKSRETELLAIESMKGKRKSTVDLHQKLPVSPAVMDDFIHFATILKSDWAHGITNSKKADWILITIKMMCGITMESSNLRNDIIRMFQGSGRGLTRYSYLHHITKRNKGSTKPLKEEDSDCLYQVFSVKLRRRNLTFFYSFSITFTILL